MILSKVTLVSSTTLDFKLYCKLKNDESDVKLWMNIFDPLVFQYA